MHFKCSWSYRMQHLVVLDDSEGYFVIGGGKYINGVEGYFGPVVYYRNRIPPHSMVMYCFCQELLLMGEVFRSCGFLKVFILY